MKYMAKRGKIAVKKWELGSQKIVSRRPNRKAKWCKIQVICLKIDKTQAAKE